ncbi:N-acetylmuramoyl-L-alanine amidase [Draconibacterium halophilum]|uniref:N-acetylmuramoyl-L-alanine amidase n=1 Tax=Draconibacterium halophilum TaxID=2706887 RepID=A0A6C0RFS0_9BACT|nr:N-acetylmuramoyl-L-alanine amidase [Draconibacterium halophilum]QIA08826.1 N-acetylmuramoyl-L-alanine amidase [Draconibacterium halophilum]
MITVRKHLLVNEASEKPITFKETPNNSGRFSGGMPDTIVIHYTAGGSFVSSANWLLRKEARASAHLVIGRKGDIFQLLGLDKISWHAGRSEWNGRKNLNNYSIGIELANYGLLKKSPKGYVTSYGQLIDDDNVILASHKSGGTELPWERYTEEQLSTLEEVCLAIRQKYSINEIVGHEDIAPVRKTDPGPAFPMLEFKNKILYGRMDNSEEESNITSSGGIVLANRLNIRNAPRGNATTVSDPLKKGTMFNVLEEKGEWVKVRVQTEGWVHKNYIKYYK